jgi:hypothetical protein
VTDPDVHARLARVKDHLQRHGLFTLTADRLDALPGRTIMTTPHHTLTVSRDPDPEFGPTADITCHGVTDACAEWSECKVAECPGNTGQDDVLYDVSPHAHEQEHRRFDEQGPDDYWAVRTGFCWAENHGDAEAAEFAEEQKLGAGQYPVIVEVDDTSMSITLLNEKAAA